MGLKTKKQRDKRNQTENELLQSRKRIEIEEFDDDKLYEIDTEGMYIK